MMPQVTAAALVSENKVLAHPASVDSITTSGNKEDYVSMGMTAAIKLKRVLDNTRNVLGDRGHGGRSGARFPGSPEDVKTRTGCPCGHPLGMSDHGERSCDVRGFCTHL